MTQERYTLSFEQASDHTALRAAVLKGVAPQHCSQTWAKFLVELGERAAAATPGSRFVVDFYCGGGVHVWCTAIATAPDHRHFERVLIFGANANHDAIEGVAAMLSKVTADLRACVDPSTRVELDAEVNHLFRMLDIVGPALFSCRASSEVRSRLLASAKADAALVRTGKMDSMDAIRRLNRRVKQVYGGRKRATG